MKMVFIITFNSLKFIEIDILLKLKLIIKISMLFRYINQTEKSALYTPSWI